jgi:hypothetical protein
MEINVNLHMVQNNLKLIIKQTHHIKLKLVMHSLKKDIVNLVIDVILDIKIH